MKTLLAVDISDLPKQFPEKLFTDMEECAYDHTPPWVVWNRESVEMFADKDGPFNDSPKRLKQCKALIDFMVKNNIGIITGSRNP